MHSIFSVKSDFLGSTTARCENTLWCKLSRVELPALSYSHGTSYAWAAKKTEKQLLQHELLLPVVQDI